MDINNQYAKTGLTQQDLLSLLSEAGLYLTEAYALMGRDGYHHTARRLLDAWQFLLSDYLSNIKRETQKSRENTKKEKLQFLKLCSS